MDWIQIIVLNLLKRSLMRKRRYWTLEVLKYFLTSMKSFKWRNRRGNGCKRITLHCKVWTKGNSTKTFLLTDKTFYSTSMTLGNRISLLLQELPSTVFLIMKLMCKHLISHSGLKIFGYCIYHCKFLKDFRHEENSLSLF